VEIVTRVNSDASEGKQFLQDQLSRINYLKNVDMKFIANKEFTELSSPSPITVKN